MPNTTLGPSPESGIETNGMRHVTGFTLNGIEINLDPESLLVNSEEQELGISGDTTGANPMPTEQSAIATAERPGSLSTKRHEDVSRTLTMSAIRTEIPHRTSVLGVPPGEQSQSGGSPEPEIFADIVRPKRPITPDVTGAGAEADTPPQTVEDTIADDHETTRPNSRKKSLILMVGVVAAAVAAATIAATNLSEDSQPNLHNVGFLFNPNTETSRTARSSPSPEQSTTATAEPATEAEVIPPLDASPLLPSDIEPMPETLPLEPAEDIYVGTVGVDLSRNTAVDLDPADGWQAGISVDQATDLTVFDMDLTADLIASVPENAIKIESIDGSDIQTVTFDLNNISYGLEVDNQSQQDELSGQPEQPIKLLQDLSNLDNTAYINQLIALGLITNQQEAETLASQLDKGIPHLVLSGTKQVESYITTEAAKKIISPIIKKGLREAYGLNDPLSYVVHFVEFEAPGDTSQEPPLNSDYEAPAGLTVVTDAVQFASSPPTIQINQVARN